MRPLFQMIVKFYDHLYLTIEVAVIMVIVVVTVVGRVRVKITNRSLGAMDKYFV
jgi:hypothetical protein